MSDRHCENWGASSNKPSKTMTHRFLWKDHLAEKMDKEVCTRIKQTKFFSSCWVCCFVSDSSSVVFIQRARRTQGEMGTLLCRVLYEDDWGRVRFCLSCFVVVVCYCLFSCYCFSCFLFSSSFH